MTKTITLDEYDRQQTMTTTLLKANHKRRVIRLKKDRNLK